jgi:hypothetical protein
VEFPVSVTGVLGCLKSDYAMDRIEATREVWEPRGNSCHLGLEVFLRLERHGNDGGDVYEMEELCAGPYADWIQPLITHDRWAQVQVIASERPTCCLKRRVAGTFDVAFIDPALPPSPLRPDWVTGPARVLADLKSLGENGSTYSTAAQLGGYHTLEHHGPARNWYDYGQTIWARPGQTNFSPLYSVDELRLAWAGAWATWKARASEPGFIS